MNLLVTASFNIGINTPADFDSDMLRTLLIVLIPIAIIQLVLFVSALISLLRKPVPMQDKVVWLIIILLVSTIGPIIYFAIGANALEQKAAQLEDMKEQQEREMQL